MTTERKLTDEKAVMQELWRKALGLPEGLTIPCATASQAARLRFALYNGVRAFRKGTAEPDATLKQALAELTISFTPDKLGLIIGPKAATGMMPQLLAIIGEVPQSVEELQEDSAMAEVAARMMRMVEEKPIDPADIPVRYNPYGARY